MAMYIHPHERKTTPNEDSDKSLDNRLNDVFEPRENSNYLNVTLRKSSVNSNMEGKIKVNTLVANGNEAAIASTDKGETRNEAKPHRDDLPINPRLLAILNSIEGKVTEQGATLTKIDLAQTRIQKSVEYAHANASDLKDRVVQLEKDRHSLQEKNKILESQNGDMNRRIGNIEQQLALMDHGNKRRNILIDGVPESENENTTDIAIY